MVGRREREQRRKIPIYNNGGEKGISREIHFLRMTFSGEFQGRTRINSCQILVGLLPTKLLKCRFPDFTHAFLIQQVSRV